ncbi:MAG: hypothetical protein C0403_13310, partial [Desulfobacterium sp.]|nr:hypothetical protein [Desulfobacterium sp.]
SLLFPFAVLKALETARLRIRKPSSFDIFASHHKAENMNRKPLPVVFSGYHTMKCQVCISFTSSRI